MRALTQWLRGTVRAQIKGAAPLRFINACARENIAFSEMEPEDEFTVSLTIMKSDLSKAQALAANSQCTLSVVRERGAPKALRRAKKRTALFVLTALCCAALLWSSLHIWDMNIVGNNLASEEDILAALDHAGVRIGGFWPAFHNEQIKCRVLCEVPELSWLSVNVNGSHATVSVRERVPMPEIYDEKASANITAAKAGLITEVQTLQGNAVVVPGQTVLPGELLVSGEMQSTFEKAAARQVHAKARVYARTWYSLCACAPLVQQKKVYTGKSRHYFSLEIGNRRINLYYLADNSRNLNTEYDKIVKTYRLAKNGVFSTPLAITAETRNAYTLTEVHADVDRLRTELEEQLAARLSQEIGTDGTVKEQNYSCEERDGYLYVTLHAECVEDIAQEQSYTPDAPDLAGTQEGEDSNKWKESWQ